MAGGAVHVQRLVPAHHSQPGYAAKLDTSVAHIGRMQNYWRGGKDNFAADRVAASTLWPPTPAWCRRSGLIRRSWPGRCATWPVRRASASSSTSAPVFQPRGACRDRPGTHAGQPGRVRGQRPHSSGPRPCPAGQQPAGQHQLRQRRRARRLQRPGAGRGGPGFLRARRGHPGLGPAHDPGPRRSERDRAQADERCAPGQLPGPDPRRLRYRA